MPDHYIESIVMSKKNPNDIVDICKINSYWNNIFSDNNSFIWHNLIIKYYRRYYNKIKKYTTLKDYYVLLYYAEILGLINNKIIISKTQDILSLLPKIYEGDHIAILHACSNPAIIGNHAKIIMYRNRTNGNKPITYGRGHLCIQYKLYNTDTYVSKDNVDNFKNAKFVDPFIGGFNILKSQY